jgi:hypothetical protein
MTGIFSKYSLSLAGKDPGVGRRRLVWESVSLTRRDKLSVALSGFSLFPQFLNAFA